MAFNLAEPPEWWVKYKPLRWVFALVVLFGIYRIVVPRFLDDDSPPPAHTETAETKILAFPDDSAVKPQPAPVTLPTPPPAVKVEPKPAPLPAPVLPPTPPPVVRPTPPPPVAKPTPAPVAQPTPPAAKPTPPPVAKPTPAPAPKPTPPVTAKPAPTPPATPPPTVAKATPPTGPARFTAVETERVTFIDKLRSYDSVEKLQGQLRAGGFGAEQSTIEKKVPPDRYPPFRSDTLLVPNYKHGNYEGKLTLEFFNDRLYQAQFLPKQPREYLAWLRRNDVPLARKTSGRSSYTQGHLQVISNIDFATSEFGSTMSTAPFVMWEDTRLVQQMRDWGPLR